MKEERKTEGRKAHRRLLSTTLWLVMVLGMIAHSSAVPENDTQSPVILEKSPLGFTSMNPLVMRLTTDEPAECRYAQGNVHFSEMANVFTSTNATHNATLNVSEGSYTYYIACRDVMNNTGGTENLTFVLDRTPAEITINSPIGILYSKNAELNVTTNEDAVCRYDITDVVYDNLASRFEATGRRSHRQVFSSLAQGVYSYFVRCIDATGNKNAVGKNIQFTINLRPSATIAIVGGDTLRSGTYEVRLSSSEELAETPTLRYSFNDDANQRVVSLVGSGMSFSGYLIIPEAEADRIGTFVFSGIDMSGLSGSEITNGKLFIVDTKKPPAPLSLNLQNEKKGIRLEWYYSGEDADYFKIYRSTSASVDYSDYYERASGDEFYDGGVEDGVMYHYRVAAVDHAGNEGELSPERSLSAEYMTVEKKEEKLSYTLSGQVKKKIVEVEKGILDIDAAINELSLTSSADKIQVIAYFDLIQKNKNAKQGVLDLKSQLEAYLLLDLSPEELQSRLDKIDGQLKKNMQAVVNGITIVQRSEIVQTQDDSDVFNAIQEFLGERVILAEKRKEYDSRMISLNDEVQVTTRISIVRLSYLGTGREAVMSIVEKVIQGPSQGDKSYIIEIIPKSVAERADRVIAKTQPVVLNEDPVLQWAASSLEGYELKYHLDGEKDINLLKTIKTVVLKDVDVSSLADRADMGITGNVGRDVTVREEGGFSLTLNFLLVILGVIIIIGLAIYYVFIMRREDALEERESGEHVLIQKESAPAKRKDVVGQKRHDGTRTADGSSPAEPASMDEGHSRILLMTGDRAYRGSARHERAPDEKGRLARTSFADAQGDAGMHADTSHIWTLIKKADTLVDNLEVEKGYGHYLMLLDIYDYLGDNSRRGLHGRMNGIYAKLVLLQLVKEGHVWVDKHDRLKLRQSVFEIDALMQDFKDGFDDGSPFGKYVVKHREYFLETLKSMGTVQKGYSPGW